jgi:tetratricopeptide (TPR) repeat protein
MLKAAREFPSELSLWDRADSLAALAGRPTDLAEAYREVLRADLPRTEEIEICERAASLHEDKLGDPIGATPYLERVLKLDAGNEQAFTRLKDILTAAERWGELEALYDRAADATSDTSRRIEMFVEVALVCEEIIEDAGKATRYYERILEVDQTTTLRFSRSIACTCGRTTRESRQAARAALRQRDGRRAAELKPAWHGSTSSLAPARARHRPRGRRAPRAPERLRRSGAGREIAGNRRPPRPFGSHARGRVRSAGRDARSSARAQHPARSDGRVVARERRQVPR